MLPLIPLLCGLGVGSGLTGLWWYSSMSKDEQVAADRRANELAFKLYSTTVENLTEAQLGVIHRLVKQELVG
jgi:hypothetical protein